MPCLLRPELAAHDDDNAGHAGHIARMVGENLHREGISAIEEARAYQTMLDLGVSKADIAHQTGLSGVCSIHANSAREAVVKLCTLPLLAGDNISLLSAFKTEA